MVVLGSGGHTSEMMALLEAVDGRRYDPVHWVRADTDTTSFARLGASNLALLKNAHETNTRHEYHVVPRSREVGQSWGSTLLTTARATASSCALVFTTQPDVLLLNGPGTCVPLVLGALALGVASAGAWRPKIIFVESFCRVKTLSMTGRILYRIADAFYVQWPQLEMKYPRAKHVGVLY